MNFLIFPYSGGRLRATGPGSPPAASMCIAVTTSPRELATLVADLAGIGRERE
jgi:hypothetical protein